MAWRLLLFGADHGPKRRCFPYDYGHSESGARASTSEQRGRDAIGAKKSTRGSSVVLELSCRTAAQRCRRGPRSHAGWL